MFLGFFDSLAGILKDFGFQILQKQYSSIPEAKQRLQYIGILLKKAGPGDPAFL
jgi:hypothetical protein